MFRVYEIYASDLENVSNEFGIRTSEYSRGFVLDEDGIIGFCLISLVGGRVLVNKPVMRLKETSSETEARFYDLLIRAVLNILIDMQEIVVFTKFVDNALLKFGFNVKGEEMTAVAKNITLCCH